MDITDASDQRLQIRVDLFLEGQPLVYETIVFRKDKERALKIDSLSDWGPDRSTPEQAIAKISNVKSALTQLMVRNPTFRSLAERLPQEHFFCHDYGMGIIILGEEINNRFKWIYLPKSE